MKVLFHLKEHQEMIRNWITEKMKHSTSAEFPIEWIPDTGIIVTTDDDSRKLAAVVVYFERSSPVAYIGWIAANPENTLEESANSIAFGIRCAINYSRTMGAKHLLTTSGNRRINQIFDRIGFLDGDQCVKHKYYYLGE